MSTLGDSLIQDVRRPDREGLIQLHQKFFDPIMGEGSWAFYMHPDTLYESDDWRTFEGWVTRKLILECKNNAIHLQDIREFVDQCLTLMSNFSVINIDLVNGEIDTYMNGVMSGKRSFWNRKDLQKEILKRSLTNA